MRRNLTLFIAAAAVLAGLCFLTTEGWIYLVAALAALAIVTVIRYFRSPVMRLTRWAKGNPFKAQVLIAFLQFIILAVGLTVGYNLKQLGYNFTQAPIIVFSVLLSLGFALVPFLRARKTVALPITVNKDRLAYMTIALSAFAIMVVTGNRVETSYPNSGFSKVLRTIDQAMFSQERFLDDESETALNDESFFQQTAFASIAVNGASSIHPGKGSPPNNKMLKKAKRFEKRFAKRKEMVMKRIEALRKAFSTGETIGIVFLIILLVITSCAGICLIVLSTSAGTVLLGLAILGLSVFGIVKLVSRRKSKPPKRET